MVSADGKNAINQGLVTGADETRINVNTEDTKFDKISLDGRSGVSSISDIQGIGDINGIKSIGGSIANAGVDVLGQSDEFDELKKGSDYAQKGKSAVANVGKIRQRLKQKKLAEARQRTKNAEQALNSSKQRTALNNSWKTGSSVNSTSKSAEAGIEAGISGAKAGAEVGASVGATGGSSGSIGGVVGGVAIGPVIGIVALVMLGIMLIITFVLILTAVMSSKNNTGGLTGVEKEIAESLMRHGYDKIHTSAIMGNMSVESGFRSNALQSGGDREYLSGNERTNWQGYGLNQMTNGRKNNMCSVADSKGVAHSNIDAQVDYFCSPAEKSERNWNRSLWARYNCTPITRGQWESIDNDLDLLTRALMAFWERPNENPEINHIDKRISEAHRIFDALNSTGDGTIVGEAQAIADDDSHGYSMIHRTLNPDVDCSSLVFYACQRAGYNVGDAPFSTYNEGAVLRSAGFSEMAFTGLGNCCEGDILWNSHHTEIFKSGQTSIGAHSDYDGRAGDSSGREVCAGNASQSWVLVYRPPK